MSESLPLAFAVYPLLLSGIALIWLFSLGHQSWLYRVVLALACGSIMVFAFLAGTWAFTSYYLRYVLLGLFAVVMIFLYFRTKHGSLHFRARDSKITALPISVFLLFTVLNALAISSYSPSAKTLDVDFPLSSGTYYVLQGGASAVTNPFHAMSGSKGYRRS